MRIADVLGITADHLLKGNQKNDLVVYQIELVQVIEGCNSFEKQVISDAASAVKKILRDNKHLQHEDD